MPQGDKQSRIYKRCLNDIQITLVVKNINSRVRDRGLSAKEMCFMRDQATNRNILHKDEDLKLKQKEKRMSNHNKPSDTDYSFDVGDEVMVKDQMTKLKPREKFVVVSPSQEENKVTVQKREKKFTARQYNIPKHQLLKVPRKAAMKAKQKINDWSKLCKVSTKQNDVKLHAWEDVDDDEDQVYYTTKPVNIDDEERDQSMDDTTYSEDSTTDREHETSTETDDDRFVPNENLAEWGEEEEVEIDDDDSTTPQEEDSFHDAQDQGSNDYCPGPGLLRNILDENTTFLNQHPKRPDRTEDQKIRNILRRSERTAEHNRPDYRMLSGMRQRKK